MKNVLDIISCPTCFKVSNCDSKKCRRECVKVCQYDSVSFEDNKAKIDIVKCRSCSLCSLACPLKAIDKFPLKEKAFSELVCSSCGKVYKKINNVYLLLPQENRKAIPKLNSISRQKKICENVIDWKFISYQYFVRFNRFIDYTSPIINGNLVLDIGCASGALSSYFSNYLGLDNSLKLVSFASQKIDKPILLADARFIPLRNLSVPYFISRNLLEHTKDDMKIIYELRRVAQKGGFFELPCSDQISWFLDPVNLFLLKMGRKPLKAFTYGYGHINMVSFNEWKKRIAKGGFIVGDIKDMGNGLVLNVVSLIESLFLSYGDNDFIPANFVSKRISRLICRFYYWIDRIDPKITKAWTKIFFVKPKQ